jgi:hypothetical protein
MSARIAALSLEKSFLHLVYDYRYLALAAYAWRSYGYGADDTAEKAINSLIPGVGVLLQDSLLLHARSLIDFYTKGATDDTDILLEDFGFRPISATHRAKLKRYKPSIELHLLHLTAYRDKDYRRSHTTTARHGNPSSGRIVWNRSNKNVVTELLECLRVTAGQRGNAWSRPFSDLYNAASKELAAPGAWPAELANAGDVKKYLRSLGFTV